MTLLDAAIIYLALGSPLAVLYLTKRDTKRVGQRLFKALGLLLVWPVAGVSLGIRWLRAADERKAAERALNLRRLRIEIEAKLGLNERPFEFREVFDRLAGLTSPSMGGGAKLPFEIFSMSGHPDPALASACLSRTNRARLARHRSAASAEFAKLLSVGQEIDDDTIDELSLELGLDLSADLDAAREFYTGVTTALPLEIVETSGASSPNH